MAAEGKSILVIEDDAAIRTLLIDVLTDERYIVRAAPDGLAALAILEAWSPQLIILDQLIPRMDGAAFRSEQRTRPAIAAIPVLLLSAARDLLAQATVLEVTATMPKPFNLDELLVITARLLTEAAAVEGEDIFLTRQ